MIREVTAFVRFPAFAGRWLWIDDLMRFKYCLWWSVLELMRLMIGERNASPLHMWILRLIQAGWTRRSNDLDGCVSGYHHPPFLSFQSFLLCWYRRVKKFRENLFSRFSDSPERFQYNCWSFFWSLFKSVCYQWNIQNDQFTQSYFPS